MKIPLIFYGEKITSKGVLLIGELFSSLKSSISLMVNVKTSIWMKTSSGYLSSLCMFFSYLFRYSSKFSLVTLNIKSEFFYLSFILVV